MEEIVGGKGRCLWWLPNHWVFQLNVGAKGACLHIIRLISRKSEL